MPRVSGSALQMCAKYLSESAVALGACDTLRRLTGAGLVVPCGTGQLSTNTEESGRIRPGSSLCVIVIHMAQALRFNAGKSEVHYILFYKKFIEALAMVQTQGAIKYGYANWDIGGKEDVEYLDAGMRHMFDFFAGNFYDEDTGCQVLAQAIWNFMNVIEQNYSDWPVKDPAFDQEAYVEKWKHLPKSGGSRNVMERVLGTAPKDDDPQLSYEAIEDEVDWNQFKKIPFPEENP